MQPSDVERETSSIKKIGTSSTISQYTQYDWVKKPGLKKPTEHHSIVCLDQKSQIWFLCQHISYPK